MRKAALIVGVPGAAVMARQWNRLWPVRAPVYQALLAERDTQDP